MALFHVTDAGLFFSIGMRPTGRSRLMLWQRRAFQPAIVDAPYEFVILHKTNGLAKVGVGLEFNAFLNILGCGGRGKNDGWDRFQTVIGLNLSQYFSTAHFWEV